MLRDGAGLHSDGIAEWYITHWDIRYVQASQASDHFHLDHREYYMPFMNRYRSGIPRNEVFLNDMSKWPIELLTT